MRQTFLRLPPPPFRWLTLDVCFFVIITSSVAILAVETGRTLLILLLIPASLQLSCCCWRIPNQGIGQTSVFKMKEIND